MKTGGGDILGLAFEFVKLDAGHDRTASCVCAGTVISTSQGVRESYREHKQFPNTNTHRSVFACFKNQNDLASINMWTAQLFTIVRSNNMKSSRAHSLKSGRVGFHEPKD